MCLALLSSPGLGGISNTVAVINGWLQHAMVHGYGLVFNFPRPMHGGFVDRRSKLVFKDLFTSQEFHAVPLPPHQPGKNTPPYDSTQFRTADVALARKAKGPGQPTAALEIVVTAEGPALVAPSASAAEGQPARRRGRRRGKPAGPRLLPLGSSEFDELAAAHLAQRLVGLESLRSAYTPPSWGEPCAGTGAATCCSGGILAVPADAMKQAGAMFDYSLTSPALREAFYRQRGPGEQLMAARAAHLHCGPRSSPVAPCVRVVLHHRGGDVSRKVAEMLHSLEKKKGIAVDSATKLSDLLKLSPNFSLVVWKRVALTYSAYVWAAVQRVVRSACLQPSLVTEDAVRPKGMPPPTELAAFTEVTGVPTGTRCTAAAAAEYIPRLHAFRVADVSCARRDFEDLVGADVLVAGESGFPRLASVLSQQTRVDIESPTHHGLGNINDDDLIVVPRLDLFWTLSWVPHFLAEVEALTRTGGAAPATDGLDASTDALVADYKAAMALGAADESLKRSLAESLARKLPARTAEQCLREAP